MKILYVITRSDVMGGASMHLLDLALGASRAGYEILILAGGNGVFFNRAHDKGLSCISLKYMVREINPLKDLLAFFELKKQISKYKPDIVHLHSSKAGILGRLASAMLDIPVVFTAHGWAFTEGVSNLRRAFYRLVEAKMAKYAARIITVSDYDQALALRLGVGASSMISTIHNGISYCSQQPRALPRARPSEVRMIMVARFDRPKNHAFLLSALADVAHLPWSIEFVGDGPLLSTAKKLATDLELQDRVIFSGECNDVECRLLRSDIFILISDWEGLPLTIIEAMRAQLPVIASDVGGVPELVERERSGYLVSRNDKVALVEALESLIHSAEIRLTMGAHGRSRFDAFFTLDGMLNKTFDIYQEVSERK
ncbi:glycosyltransferase family 4 protein [Pseudomonas sp. TUM22785]|uniref:glycosyltransferase family 4 protein n=1 Tax=Pseudomonas sp. TUM22785 TaxID=3019098 RepID=UPI0023051F93|nr:glycosyltransferase family 4 protein [Pseudomonas sp. TUM22785]WCD82154.1 glycosyltransferase family 4 protein [Pseudomonas sp. TUM22785]